MEYFQKLQLLNFYQMQIPEEQTALSQQASLLNISTSKSQDLALANQRTKKKKKIIEVSQFQNGGSAMTQKKKQKRKSQQGMSQKSLKVKSQATQKRKKKKIANFKNKSELRHAPVYQKFFVSLIFTLISMALFSKPPTISYPLANFEEGTHQSVFEIVTDRKSRTLSFNTQNKKQGYFGFSSSKSARVKAQVDYALGYKFKNRYEDDANNSQIQMSDLQILQYKINNITLERKENGLWNSWEFEDFQNVKQYIKEAYLQEMQKQTLEQISDQRKQLYQSKAKFMLTQMVDQYQSWFDWLIKRVDKILDGSLQPYVKKFEIVYNEKKDQNNQK